MSTDKLAHFFDTGYMAFQFESEYGNGVGLAYLQWLEGIDPNNQAISDSFLSANPSTIFWSGGAFSSSVGGLWGFLEDRGTNKPASPADVAAGVAGMRFWSMLDAAQAEMYFDICHYVTQEWDESKNPNIQQDLKPFPSALPPVRPIFDPPPLRPIFDPPPIKP